MGVIPHSLAKRLFTTRLELISELDRPDDGTPGPDDDESALRKDAASMLHTEVSSMNLDNFVVRPQRKLVEKFSQAESWKAPGPEDLADLASDAAGLPSETDHEDEEVKRFDLLMLRLQLTRTCPKMPFLGRYD